MNKPSLSAEEAASRPNLGRGYLEEKPYDPEPRRDWVRAGYLGLLVLTFVGVIAYACYENQHGDWAKAKDLLAIIFPALTALIGAGTSFYFKAHRD